MEKCVAAEILIDTFRRNLTKYYGESSEVFDMHARSHLEEDVIIFFVTIEFKKINSASFRSCIS